MKDIIRKAGEKTATTGLKAAKKAAPTAARVAMKTGQVALKVGAIAANAGSDAVAEHTRKREEKEQGLIDGLKTKYPGCFILLSKFNPYNEDLGGTKSSLKKIVAYEMYDENYDLQYSAEGIIDIEYGRRKLHVYDMERIRVGSCTEHGILRTIVSVESGGDHITDISPGFRTYEFSDLRYEYMKEKSSKGILVGYSGRVLMEIRRIKGLEVIAVVDPTRAAESVALYSALKLPRIQRPSSVGGGG